jgi:hypothetical protein
MLLPGISNHNQSGPPAYKQFKGKPVNLQEHPENHLVNLIPLVGGRHPETTNIKVKWSKEHFRFQDACNPETSSHPFSSLTYTSHSQKKIC